jgi:HlyD family secretion protein
LLSIKTSIKSYKDAFPNTDLDLKSSLLSVKQKEIALADLKENLSKYNVRAPFGGIIASVPVQVGENVSSGTVLATIITSKKIATIPFTEVDIAKIKLGQKATLTFDAISNLTITGRVEEIDSIGTVSQGVVNYNVKISFDTNDSRIKPGMSTSVAIITNIKQNILAIPNSAIKTQNNASYIEVFNTALPEALPGIQGSISTTPPTKINIETGISSDTLTEVISGLKEGDIIVIKTITGTTKTTNTSTKNILSSMGGNKPGVMPRN